MSPRRFDVWLCGFDPTVGHEIGRTRPAVVVSPDVFNDQVSWFTVAPMTTGGFPYNARVPVTFAGQAGTITVDQLRCVARARLIKRLGEIDASTQVTLLATLAAFFAP